MNEPDNLAYLKIKILHAIKIYVCDDSANNKTFCIEDMCASESELLHMSILLGQCSPLIILDNPCANLSFEMTEKLKMYMNKLNKQFITSTHNLDIIKADCTSNYIYYNEILSNFKTSITDITKCAQETGKYDVIMLKI